MIVICHIYESVTDLLPHFLKHYSSWGATKFYFGVYRGESNPVWNEIKEIGRGIDIELYHAGDKTLDCAIEGDFKNYIMSKLKKDEWIIPTDLDEFHTIDGFTSFQQLQDACELENADYVWSKFVDHIRPDGEIPMHIDPDISIWEQFPKKCNISHTIAKAYCRKLCMVKQSIPLKGGHHEVDPGHTAFSKEANTHHFKWFGPLYDKEMEKLITYCKQKRPWLAEQARLLEFLNQHDGNLLGFK